MSDIGSKISWPERHVNNQQYKLYFLFILFIFRVDAHTALVAFMLQCRHKKHPTFQPWIQRFPTEYIFSTVFLIFSFINGVSIAYEKKLLQYVEGSDLAFDIESVKLGAERSLVAFREMSEKHPGLNTHSFSNERFLSKYRKR